MKVRITATSNKWDLFFWNDYEPIEEELKQAGFPVYKELKPSSYSPLLGLPESGYAIYTEIDTLDDLNRLVKAFGKIVVYSFNSDNEVVIEKYDDFRE